MGFSIFKIHFWGRPWRAGKPHISQKCGWFVGVFLGMSHSSWHPGNVELRIWKSLRYNAILKKRGLRYLKIQTSNFQKPWCPWASLEFFFDMIGCSWKNHHVFVVNICQHLHVLYISIWKVPESHRAPNHPWHNGISYYKPSSYGATPYENPQRKRPCIVHPSPENWAVSFVPGVWVWSQLMPTSPFPRPTSCRSPSHLMSWKQGYSDPQIPIGSMYGTYANIWGILFGVYWW